MLGHMLQLLLTFCSLAVSHMYISSRLFAWKLGLVIDQQLLLLPGVFSLLLHWEIECSSYLFCCNVLFSSLPRVSLLFQVSEGHSVHSHLLKKDKIKKNVCNGGTQKKPLADGCGLRHGVTIPLTPLFKAILVFPLAASLENGPNSMNLNNFKWVAFCNH